MIVHYPTDLSGVEKKIEELKQKNWYQRWWGILILGIIASTIVIAVSQFFITK